MASSPTGAPSSVIIDTGDVLRLRNDHETEPLVIVHKNRRIVIEPGRSAIVPFEIIRIWWGDPRARTGEFRKFSDSFESGYVNKREEEIKRLGVLYGSYCADVVTLNDPSWPMGHADYGQPKRTPWPVTVTTEAGQPIVPCGLDLSNEAVYGAVQAESENLDDAVQYREHLERQLDDIREQLRRVTGTESDDTEVDGASR